MKAIEQKRIRLKRRRQRCRRRSVATKRVRLLVTRTLAHIYAQIIDDGAGKTVAAASTRETAIRRALKSTGNIEAATAVGKAVGERALAKGITAACFDRGGRKYHGRVKALADAAREAGLKF